MSDAEHLLENGLFLYRLLYKNDRTGDFYEYLKSDPIIKDQIEYTGMDMECLMDMVTYVYFDVMDTEEKREDYFHDRPETKE